MHSCVMLIKLLNNPLKTVPEEFFRTVMYFQRIYLKYGPHRGNQGGQLNWVERDDFVLNICIYRAYGESVNVICKEPHNFCKYPYIQSLYIMQNYTSDWKNTHRSRYTHTYGIYIREKCPLQPWYPVVVTLKLPS